MKELLLKLINGVKRKDIERKDAHFVATLFSQKIVDEIKDNIIINHKFKVGTVDIAKSGIGFLEVIGGSKEDKDLLIEAKDLNGATRGDLVIAKTYLRSGRRPSAKVVLVVDRAFSHSVCIVNKMGKNTVISNIKTLLPIEVVATKKSLNALPEGTILKVNNNTAMIEDVLGVIDDPMVDEKISLALFNKKEFFSRDSEEEAKSFGDFVDGDMYPDRVDLRDLPFCTIDPDDAKDFDDAIYFDKENFVIYVAIADVSEYVTPNSNIDKEAKERGFSIYFPHKSIPMLPRALSENICSLKPNEDRLAFTFKITLNRNSLAVEKEELFDAVINSKKRFTYSRVDEFLDGEFKNLDYEEEIILNWLLDLYKVTAKLKKARLSKGYDFANEEVRIKLDSKQNIIESHLEKETPSHALIEDCMLLANMASAKMIKYGIFRVHEEPSFEKIDELLTDLATIGIVAKNKGSIHELIVELQKEAKELNISKYVDKMIIKSQKQAKYSADNIGHFGLGFKEYSHFTSPIRRYSDLTLHRLLKSMIRDDTKYRDYILRNIEPLCLKISDLERESAKVEWDFEDRKFARYAKANIGKAFNAVVVDLDRDPIANFEDGLLAGARVFLKPRELELFDKVIVEIIDADMLNAKILGKVVKVIKED